MRDLTDFEKGQIVGARMTGASITKVKEVFGFSRATRETTDMKKTPLTTNGVLVLYNASTSSPVKVQVIFAMEWSEQILARVSDGKFISPVVRFPYPSALRKDLYAGYIITVKQAKLVETEMDQCPMMDYQIPHLQIEDYAVSERGEDVHGELTSCTDYWACLRRVGTHLSKFDKSFQANMEREQARMTANEVTANQLRERGNSLYKQGLYEKAIQCYQNAAKKKVYDDRIYANQSLANIQMEKFEVAVLLAKYAVKNNPFNVKAYYRACQCYERLGDDFQLFLMARACKVVCGDTSDMEKYRSYVDKFKIEIPSQIPAATASVLENNALRSRSLSVAGRGVPEPKKSFVDKVKQRDKSALPVATAAPGDAKPPPSDAGKSASPPAKHSVCEDDDEQLEKKKLEAALEKKKKEDEGVLAPGYSDSGKDVALISLLREGRRFLKEGSYGQALEFYTTSIETGLVNHRGRKEQQLVSLVVCLCRVEAASVPECVAAIPSLQELLLPPTQDPDAVLPRAPIHYLLAMAHYYTWQSNEVTTHATECQQWLKKEKNKLPLLLPGFKDPIAQTEVSFLQSWYSDGAWRKEDLLQVVAKCRYQDCDQLKGTGHYRNIIKHATLYSGHYDLSCEESCIIYYHPSCWRIVKEELAEEEKERTGTKTKLGDKDFLNRSCLTPDCNGLIICINIYDESGERKEFHTKDRNISNASSSKQKKKKNKKKAASMVQYNKNKGKGAASKDGPADEEDAEEIDGKGKENIDSTDEVPNISKGLSKPGSNLPLDELDFDNANIKILKPECSEKNENVYSKKNRRKNKKQRTALTLESLLPSPLDSSSSEQNEYVAKIRRLNAQKEALEGGPSAAVTDDGGAEDGPVLDPRKPWYTPQHLHDAPDTLARLFADRTNPVSDYQLSRFATANITQDAVHALLSFMYDFIKSEGPISVDDPKLKHYMLENFPAESTKYVHDCGGLRKFLLRSVDFALVDDVISVREHVLKAQERVAADLADKFKSNKYTMSDKFHAQKLSHLIEGSKLSRSSSSSSLLSSNTSTSWSLSNGQESVGGAAHNLSHNQSFNSGFFNPANTTVLASTTDPNSTLVNDISSAPSGRASRDGGGSSALGVSLGTGSSVSQLDQFEPPISCGTPRRPSAVNMASTPRKHSVTSAAGLEDSNADLDVSTHRLFEVARDDAVLAAEAAEQALAAMQEKLQQALQALALRDQQLQQEVEAKNDLQDKLAQVRNKMKGELTTLKKQRENEEETAQAERRRTEQLKSQLTAEQRRMQSEKHKLVEENKSLLSKVNALQLHNDQLSQQTGELQTQVDQLTVSSSRLEDQLRVVQASLSSAADRARKAEQGYIDLNRSLTEKVIASALQCCHDEVLTLQQLERHATQDSRPSARLLLEARREVEEHMRRLEGDLANLGTMSDKFCSMLNAGRPLSSLPRQSLPSVPDTFIFSKAIYLLSVGQGSVAPGRGPSSHEPLPHALRPAAALASASIDSGHSSPQPNGFRHEATALDGVRRKADPAPPTAVRASQVPATDKVNQLLRSLGVEPTSNGGAAVAASTPDVVSQLLQTLGVEVTSSSSGPRSGLPAASSPGPPEPNPLASDAHQLFVGKLPPSFTNEQLKRVFAQYGEVYSARVVEVALGNNAKYGIVAFTRTHDRDQVLRRVEKAPMTYGTYVLNVQPLNSALQRKGDDTRRPAVPPSRGAVAPPPRPSLPNTRHAAAYAADAAIELDINPKFQNMRPVVRPEAAVGAALPKKPVVTINSAGRQTITPAAGLQPNSSYLRLAEKCRNKLGPGYSDDSLLAAITEVRRLNNNSLTGLAEDAIVERVEQMLKRPVRRQNPWANLTPVTPPAALPHEAAVDVRDEECCICVCVMDKPSEVMRLDCGHYFHTHCINKWLAQKRDCPICRKHTINKEDYPSLTSAK